MRLADAGVPVALVEARKRLGGRATSFADPHTGQLLDNCQHVLMRCCTNLLDLYHRLGVADKIRWHSRFNFRDSSGRLDTLKAGRLPAPLHLARSLWGFRSLGLGDKWALTRAMFAIIRLGHAKSKAWHDRSFADWLAAQRQTSSSIEKFWMPIAVSALNEQPERMAADYALQMFQQAFLAHARAFEMGLPTVPLVQLYDAAAQVITAGGGDLMLAASVVELVCADRRVSGARLADGRILPALAVVSALPSDRLAAICSDTMCGYDERLRRLDEFQFSPIIGVHLWFAGTVMDLPHLALTQSSLQWLFNKGVAQEGQGQHLHGVISGAYELMDKSPDDLIRLLVAEARKALPAAGDAQLLHARVIKTRRATFSPRPGSDRLRPLPGRRQLPSSIAAGGSRGYDNLYLAGDWCQTGWPATMESAVRSGYRAAADVLTDSGRPTLPLAPDLPDAALYRLFSRRK